MRDLRKFLFMPVLIAISGWAHAGGGPLGIDHEWSLDTSGIWAHRYQTGLEVGVVAIEVGGALWLGNDDRLGHTFWQTVDASAISAIRSAPFWLVKRETMPIRGASPASAGRPNSLSRSCLQILFPLRSVAE